MSKGKGFHKLGDWGKLKMASTSLAKDLKKAEVMALKKIGLKGETVAKEYILSQPSSWQPLNAEYKKWKEANKRSNKTLISSSSYLQSITHKIDARAMVAYAGVTKKTTHKESKRPMMDIAKVHEFGSKGQGIPARPVWRPTLALVKKWILDSRVVEKEIKKQFNKYRS